MWQDETPEDEKDLRTDWQKYVDLPQVSAKVDLLKWWTANAENFPTVAEMAMQA